MRMMLGLMFLCLGNLSAKPFSEAKINKAIGSVIKEKTLIQTGPNSKVELDFLDGSLARIGANARFSFSPGSRETRLDSGTLLFSSPKDAGGVTVRAAGITATATGPVDFEVANLGGNVKVICLSGKPTVYLTSNPRVKDGLVPGQMLSIPPGAVKLSRADVVDLKVLLSTSTLMQMGALPSKAVLDRNAKKQGVTMPINLPGGAENTIQSGQATRTLVEVQQRQQQQMAQVAADQLAAQQLAKQQLALQQQQAQQLAAQQLEAEQAKAKQVALEQEQQQLAQANASNQGKGPQGQGQGPQGNQGQGPKDHVPPGQAKKQ